MKRGKAPDILLVSILAVAAAAIATTFLLSDGSPARAVVVVVFVFTCPGYAVVRALFGSATPAGALLVTLSLAMSLAAAIAAALALHAVGLGVGRTQMTLALGAITVVGAATAVARSRPEERLGAPSWRKVSAVVTLGAVFAVLYAALDRPLPNSNVAGYTLLGATRIHTSHVRVTIVNAEAASTTYELKIFYGRVVVAHRRLKLARGESRTSTLSTGNSDRDLPLVVRLYRSRDLHVYRELQLRT